MSVLKEPHLHDEEAAYAWVEARVWPDGPVCPHCRSSERIGKLNGKSTRIGVYKCYACRKPFSVKVGTVFESSHIPLHIWLQAMFLMCSSKKGISSNQLHRTLGITLKSAWFLSHRIREAMRRGELAPMGGLGGIVEADETYLWKQDERRASKQRGDRPFTKRGMTGPGGKRAIISLVERGGSVRSFHVENADKPTVNIIVAANIAREARVMTDESRLYGDVASHAASHERVRHSVSEWVRATCIPTRLRASSRSSRGECVACTTIARRSTCIATLPSTISGTIIGSGSALMTLSALSGLWLASSARG